MRQYEIQIMMENRVCLDNPPNTEQIRLSIKSFLKEKVARLKKNSFILLNSLYSKACHILFYHFLNHPKKQAIYGFV